ncbi:AraC family transcriptional regulator [Arenicella xantha]|uniref:AraC family transcriptional regulator n=1 Tax=Arenicella xantha TaxID=644221 RepID=A0A395JPT0_9GAMM|nr:AraC family transcriptional regulator [Arenicella xantha]RBP53660.1 AraC family transcriptional regulator [Arenicella xantha]
MNLNIELAARIDELTPTAGVHSTSIDNFNLVKNYAAMSDRVPIIYQPCIYIVVQGSKSALLGSEVFVYDALNYLVLSVPLPLECQIETASEDAPYLAVRIDIDRALLSELMVETAAKQQPAPSAPSPGIFVSTLNHDIQLTLSRLLSYLHNAEQAKFLGKLAIKELLFHVLNGAQGDLLRAFAHQDRQNFQIAKVIGFIQQQYSKNLEVADLAAIASMSESSFYSYFKTVTSCSPIQYIKAIRLHAARRNILFDNFSASDAAYNVGYSSPSQFSREYRRFFGTPPSADTQTHTTQTS